MTHDVIADMLIRIKNAGTAGKDATTIPFSNFKFAVAKVLADKGYVKTVAKKGKGVDQVIELEIAYNKDRTPRIQGLARISRPSRRVYYNAKHIAPVRNGLGLLILSTPKGILAGEDAKKSHVGGEALFKIW